MNTGKTEKHKKELIEGQQYLDDEIDLRDYIRVIVKRKWVILWIFIICVLSTTIASLFMPKIYETDLTIRIGKIARDNNSLRIGKIAGDDNSLISNLNALKVIKERKVLASAIKHFKLDKIDIPALDKMIKVKNIKGTDFIQMKMESQYPELAAGILKYVANVFIQQQGEKYNKSIKLTKKEIQESERECADIKTQEKNLSKTLSQLSQGKALSPGLFFIQDKLVNYENIYSDLQNKIYSLKKGLLDSRPSKIFNPPLVPKYPVKPKKRLMAALSGVLGLMLGVFVAFFMEYWQKEQ